MELRQMVGQQLEASWRRSGQGPQDFEIVARAGEPADFPRHGRLIVWQASDDPRFMAVLEIM